MNHEIRGPNPQKPEHADKIKWKIMLFRGSCSLILARTDISHDWHDWRICQQTVPKKINKAEKKKKQRVQPNQGTQSNNHPRLKPNEIWRVASLQENTSKCHDPGVATFVWTPLEFIQFQKTRLVKYNPNQNTIESRDVQPDWGTPRHEFNKV